LTLSQFVQIEFGALGSTHNIGGVTDLDNRNAAGFAGGFAEFRYLALARTLATTSMAGRPRLARWQGTPATINTGVDVR
jgi:hypothetical protein